MYSIYTASRPIVVVVSRTYNTLKNDLLSFSEFCILDVLCIVGKPCIWVHACKICGKDFRDFLNDETAIKPSYCKILQLLSSVPYAYKFSRYIIFMIFMVDFAIDKIFILEIY